MCWRAFKCGELGRGRRCGVLPILHARQGAGRGHGVLTMRGGAGSGGRREKALGSHVLGTNFRGFTTGEIGSRGFVAYPCSFRQTAAAKSADGRDMFHPLPLSDF